MTSRPSKTRSRPTTRRASGSSTTAPNSTPASTTARLRSSTASRAASTSATARRRSRQNVATLAAKGVVYVTVAPPVLPPGRDLRAGDPVPALGLGLQHALPAAGGRGPHRSAAGTSSRRLCEHRILVDLSHMRPDAVRETFDVLDRARPCARDARDLHARRLPLRQPGLHARAVGRRRDQEARRRDRPDHGPVPARRMGSASRTRRIAANPASDPQRTSTHSPRQRSGPQARGARNRLDGFIKPTMTGLDDMAELARLEEWLRNE